MTETQKEHCKDIIALYHLYCPQLSPVTKVSAQKQRELCALMEKYRYHDFLDLFSLVEKSPYLRGQGRWGWKADFDWLTTPENMEKVIGDHYTPARTAFERWGDLSMYRIALEIHQENGQIKFLDVNP